MSSSMGYATIRVNAGADMEDWWKRIFGEQIQSCTQTSAHTGFIYIEFDSYHRICRCIWMCQFFVPILKYRTIYYIEGIVLVTLLVTLVHLKMYFNSTEMLNTQQSDKRISEWSQF